MRLLILTQKVDKNDPILGFFHRWIEEFAKHCEQLTVICLERGQYYLPANVKVLSLGKPSSAEASKGKGRRLFYIWNFYKYIWNEKRNYDAVFVHMNPEHVVLGGLIWKLLKKKIVLWYTHRQVNIQLRLAEKLSNTVLTSSKESFGIKSKKVQYLGHGINIDTFQPSSRDWASRILLCVGRITPIKNGQVLLDSLVILRKSDPRWQVVFIGDPVTDPDQLYKKELEDKVERAGLTSNVKFIGSLPSLEINERFSKAFASVNMTPTGGMDKVVLESLASGCPVFTSNTAFQNLFEKHSTDFISSFGDASDLAQRITQFDSSADRENMVRSLSEKVREEYGVTNVVSKIFNILQT